MAADIADFGITLAAFRDLPPLGRIVTLAMTGAAGCAASRIVARVDEDSTPPA
jgi:hypothetical protein